MGTHPSAPSLLAEGPAAGTPLLAALLDAPEALGAALPVFGADLPFLFKVLSVRTALSIQSHPDKALAERLHRENPAAYKDDNHKPEMALALEDFEALCGFAPHEEIAPVLEAVPELRRCCGEAATDAYVVSDVPGRKAALKAVFTALMTAPADLVATCVGEMRDRLQSKRIAGDLTPKEDLVLRLEEQYPGDVGVLSAWFLNYMSLKAGEAIFLAANVPHAYLSGELVECMATSDNVIRAGLTPKMRDTGVLCESLTYEQGPPEVLGGEHKGDSHLALYRPPFREFEIWRLAPLAGETATLAAARGPMVMLVQRGSLEVLAGGEEVREVTRGDCFFVAAGTALKVAAKEDATVWFAAPNCMGFDLE
jgi:mannose-6-phosphate isomerase